MIRWIVTDSLERPSKVPGAERQAGGGVRFGGEIGLSNWSNGTFSNQSRFCHHRPNKEILLVCRRNLVLLRVLGMLHVLKLLWGKFRESRLAQKFKIALKKFKTSSFHWYFYSIMKIFDQLTCFKMLFLKFDPLKDIFWDLNFRRKFPLKLCFNIRHIIDFPYYGG